MNRQGEQEVGALFRELGSISELLSEYAPDKDEAVILPDASLSLMEQMRELSGEVGEGKPVIRTIHHFACTGGTLISKCLSALPNVFLLSEVHPFSALEILSGRAAFSPSNCSRLARYASIPDTEKLAFRIFEKSIHLVYEHVKENGGTLVLRDHAHSDYCVGKRHASASTLITFLTTRFEVRKIATVRDPIDSYLSISKNKWMHFSPPTFDEYCRRYIEFAKQFSENEVFRYEDFVEDPDSTMESMCNILDLQNDKEFPEVFGIFNVTGDSGRSGARIGRRPRVELSPQFVEEVNCSQYYRTLANLLNY